MARMRALKLLAAAVSVTGTAAMTQAIEAALRQKRQWIGSDGW